MKFHVLAVVVLFVLMAFGSAFAEEDTMHVSQTLTSPSLRLEIDADIVPIAPGTRLPIYETSYPFSEKTAWLEVFFGDSRAEVVDGFAGKSKEALLSSLITDAERERAYSLGSRHTRYQSYFCALAYSATDREIFRNIPSVMENAQAEGIILSPAQAREIAQNWVDQLASTLGWEGFAWRHTYALPANDGRTMENSGNYIATGVYLVEFERFFNGIPVARDVLPNSEIEGDLLQLYLDDSGILRIDGICRSYAEQDSAVVRVSLEDALGILKENMAAAFPNQDGEAVQIREVELCYRLLPKLQENDLDYHAVMTARPAWRFASGICRNQTNVFVMYIDAETGEVLE